MKFSIITPSRSHSEWLKLCVASVADQQGVEKEHIVQDSGSDDGTLDWITSDERVRAFVEQDTGMYDAINRGIERASGDVLAYLNCDEQYLPGALAGVAEFLTKRPDIEIVFADALVVDPEGNLICFRKEVRLSQWHIMTSHLPVLSCAMFFRRALLDKHQVLFDENLKSVGDAHWVLAMLKRGVNYAMLRRYTSVFTETGSNLGLDRSHSHEADELVRSAPVVAKAFRSLLVAQHRARKLLAGCYRRKSVHYSIYTRDDDSKRKVFDCRRPDFRWRRREECRQHAGPRAGSDGQK